MNIKLLNEIKKQIKKEPYQFDMRVWFTQILSSKDAAKIKIPNCGTAACIAGWAIAINNKENPDICLQKLYQGIITERPASEAGRLLEIDYTQCQRLFYVTDWPQQFKLSKDGKRFSSLTKKQQAKLAIKRINHFIKTNGVE